ncbi:MAG TPA: DNA mismatch repair protein MutS [Candidatus Limnocylindrales bacterium]|nr:DNA mismatch repair protein MutS [Candidatus Limnocylindrales bacterium]
MTTATAWSPMLEQYFGMKHRYPEAILLSRVGDFYEAYGDDAETIARALSIALTSKEAGGGRRVAMAGVPHHALDGYLAKLVAQRRVVALAEQLEAPIPNKLVRRDVVRVVTPGTLLEEHILDRSAHNYLAAITAYEEVIALAHADISTGHVAATAFEGHGALEDVFAEIARLDPAELVADVPADVRAALDAVLVDGTTRITSPALAAVSGRARETVEGFSIDASSAMHRALDALGAFVRRVSLQQNGETALREPQFYRQATFLALDANTRKHLELTKALGANPKATLFATVDRTRTAMGARLLGRWLLAPLVDADAIGARADCVEALVRDAARRLALQDVLHGCFDLERIAQKVRFRRVLPRDLGSLRRTLMLLDPILDALREESLPRGLRAIAERVGDFESLRADLAATLVDDPPATIADGGVIRAEASAELAECVALRTDARARIAALEERERERSGIKSLKVKYASAFGYAIEVPKAQTANVPPDYTRKQTLANGERYVTPELRELDVAIASAESRQQRLELALYERLVDRIAERVDELLATADALAELDAYCSLAHVAGERGYVRPSFAAESVVEFTDGRHPVMESLLGSSFVPNDVQIGVDRGRFILLTGPNMGGKSTYLRQTALLVILAQIGSFVPARAGRLGIVDRIFTRIGAGDDLASGQSTFYIEMAEAANILRRATDRSLLLIDELGRGTGTVDGLAIAQAICEYLLERESRAPMVLFATHFHELVSLSERWTLVANYHITAVESTRGGGPVFSHRVLPGSSSRSFGIEVARMAGLPPTVVARAREVAAVLEGRPALEAAAPLRGKLAKPEIAEQPLLFELH